ncbi:fungal-specific transcription factor domain-containing protein [Biscogniauxia mediterranea]|nr:fungal-specific transcription factor domain-containing protein [Biscogniauxia mediterranea]
MDPPAAATTRTSATVATPKAQSKPLSCTSCRARKLKCDRQHPCRSCVRSGLPECVFPERKRSRRPRKSKNSELLERLHRLESIVGKVRLQNLGRDGSLPLQLDAGGTTDAAQSCYTAASDLLDNLVKQTEKEATTTTTTATPRTRHPLPYEGTASSSPPGIIPGSESQGQGARPQDSTVSRYLSGDFWASLCEEVGGLRQALEEQSVDSDADEDDGSLLEEGTTPESTSTAKGPSYTPPTAMLLGGGSAGAAHAPLRHPRPEHIRFLAATYFQNVDMLLKILHRPSVSAALRAFAGRLEHQPSQAQAQAHHLLSPEREALFFAIYYAAVTSLPASECAARLGGASRGELAHSYRAGLERALARADYLNSSSLETLQALTLYASCLRSHDGSRSSWALLSLPVRLAQALDLHRDGDGGGEGRLTPFEAEQRRRLWWQLIVLDIRAAEDRGTRAIIARDSYDTRLPHNVDDADFGPETAEPLARLEKPPGAPSDVTFSLCTAESSGIFLYFEHAQNIVDVPPPPPSSSSSAFAAGGGAGAGGNSIGSSSGGGGGSSNDYPTDEATVVRLARHLEAKFVHGADPSHAASYLASVTVRLIILKLWLVMRYPLHRRPPRPIACSSMPKPHPHPAAPTTVSITPGTTTSPPPPAAAMMLSHESTLRTAITILELSERGRSGPFGENFRWWSELYVQWHPLAVALAELCTLHQQQIDSHQQLLQQRQQRQLTDKAWTVIDAVFPKWSEVIADTKRGTLWRPIRALYRKAREARRAAEGGGMEGQDVRASSNTTEESLSREQGQQQIPRPSDLDRDVDTDIRMDMGMGAGIGEANLDLAITGSTTGGYDGGAVAGDSNIPPDLGNLSLDMHMNSMSEEWLAWPDINFEMPPSDSTNWGDMDWSTWDQFVLDTHADHQSKSSSSEPT